MLRKPKLDLIGDIMKFIKDWKLVLTKAHSIKLMIIAGVLSGMELILPMYGADIPRPIYSSIMLVVTAAALVSRLVAQKGFPDETTN